MFNQIVRLATAAAALIAAPAVCHEFIVKPSAVAVRAGEALAATVYSTHAFIKSEEIEAADVTTVFICNDGKRTPVVLTADQPSLT